MYTDQSGFVLRGASAVLVEENYREVSVNPAFLLFIVRK